MQYKTGVGISGQIQVVIVVVFAAVLVVVVIVLIVVVVVVFFLAIVSDLVMVATVVVVVGAKVHTAAEAGWLALSFTRRNARTCTRM